MRLSVFPLFAALVLPGCSWFSDTGEAQPRAEQGRKAKAKGKARRKARKTTPEAPSGTASHQVTVKANGQFEPARLAIQPGETVEWVFEAPGDSVVPVMPGTDPCSFAATSISVPTGPSHPTPGGVFALSPDGPGWTPQPTGQMCTEVGARAGALQLCEAGQDGETLSDTWTHPGLTGVFVRLRWKDVHTGPDQYDWSALDRELNRAVAAGKQVSLGVKAGKPGTPDWLFTEGGVQRWSFQDWGSAAEQKCKNPPCCGFKMDLGSPADANYRKHYFAMLTALGQHIRSNAAWYQAVALVKPSGLNLISHEARLPKRCESECPCNTEIWAKAGYTPAAVEDFYREQFTLLSTLFPDKPQSYMLIQAGFPQVVDRSTYLRAGGSDRGLPKSVEQTEANLKLGYKLLGDRLVVQQNGLGVLPQDRKPAKEACPGQGVHPKAPPFPMPSSGCPNKWVLQAGVFGAKTGFQTNNEDHIDNLTKLDSALRNLEDNSDATFVEIYEERAWQALHTDGPLDARGSRRTLTEWNTLLRERAGIDNRYQFTFDGTTSQVRLVSARQCKAGHTQTITVKP